jgi:hypothetical protein
MIEIIRKEAQMSKTRQPSRSVRRKDLDFDLEITAPKPRGGVFASTDRQHLLDLIDRLEARLGMAQEWLDKVRSQVRIAKDNRSVLLAPESIDELQSILDGEQDTMPEDDEADENG